MGYLEKEDYEEPCCPLKLTDEPPPIPTGRILEKLDSHLSKNDYVSAERLLTYWLGEAESIGDRRGALTVLNEQIGLCRKLGRENECLRAIEQALTLATAIDLDGTVTLGTTLVNAATGYKSFGKAAEALDLYRRAKTIYESVLDPDDDRLGGLYNNMALALCDLRSFAESKELFTKAIAVMEKQTNGEAQIAITCLNLADLAVAELGEENAEKQIAAFLNKAEDLLDTPTLPHDGYHAFVCEKCAGVFGYYGYFLAEEKYKKRAKDIYERS